MAAARDGRPSPGACPDEARRRRRRGLLAGALATLGAALATGRLLRRGGGGGQGHVRLDPETVSVDGMLTAFLSNEQYLLASGWRLEQGTFAPDGGARAKGRGERLLRPG
ncbi:unnamed protein product, partial [Prorocentrum cordatum]